MTTYELIETIEVGAGGAANITFSNIPTDGTYTDLKVVISARTTNSGGTGVYATFNGSTANFSGRYLQGNGSSRYAGTITQWFGTIDSSDMTANTFSSNEIYIANYASSTTYKDFSVTSVTENNATGSYQDIGAGRWSNNSPISSISLAPGPGNFVQGSTASLFGIKSGTYAESSPKATGGLVTELANYWVHTFPYSGTFTPNQSLTNVEYLVIAGGGGGAGSPNTYEAGSGGGAGGYRCSVTGELSGGGASAESKLSLSAQGYTVIVGAGGAGGLLTTGNSNPVNAGKNGNDSVFHTITSIGGGKGADPATGSPGSGGSGGGAFPYNAYPGAGTTGQGYAGASSRGNQDFNPGFGGGGAGSAGSGTTGGIGVTSSITGTAIGRAGGGNGTNTTYYGFGGGIQATNGYAATGGGGGGGHNYSHNGGAGGSGVVIIRYPK